MCCLCCCECVLRFVSAILAYVVNSLITLIIIVCSVSLIVWVMLRHNVVKFQIHDAQLTRFNLDPEFPSNGNLHYNLSINFSIRNSNSRIGIHYDRFEARVYYNHHRFAAVSVPSFYQGHKSTVDIGTVFQGQSLVLLGDHDRRRFEDDRRRFEDDRNSGVFGVDVELKLRARLMFGIVNRWRFKPRVRCGIKLPLLPSDSSREIGFVSTNCRNHNPKNRVVSLIIQRIKN